MESCWKQKRSCCLACSSIAPQGQSRTAHRGRCSSSGSVSCYSLCRGKGAFFTDGEAAVMSYGRRVGHSREGSARDARQVGSTGVSICISRQWAGYSWYVTTKCQHSLKPEIKKSPSAQWCCFCNLRECWEDPSPRIVSCNFTYISFLLLLFFLFITYNLWSVCPYSVLAAC